MKKSVILVLIISIFFVSVIFVSLISAESNETEATNETEAEECAASISVNFNQDVYYSGDFFKITVEVFDSQGNPLPNVLFYISTYLYSENRWGSPSGSETTDEQGYHEHSDSALLIVESGKFLYKFHTEETSSCNSVEDTIEIEFIKEETEEEEEEDSETVPTVCAAEIKVTFDKEVYYIGDTAEIVIEILDSQGNPLPDYLFYFQTYDGIWHTPGSIRTDNEGYFRATPIVEKEQSALGENKFKAYTKSYTNCNSVEDIAEIEIREKKSEPVPCGIGTCIPEEDVEEVEAIPEDKILYRCNGCELEGKCYPMGYRKKGQYCSDNYEFVSQIKGKCDNSFECKSNICISGECVGEGLIKRIIKWFKKLFGGEPEEPGLKMCSKLLIEKDIGNYEYNQSLYGPKDMQVPVYSEEGEQMDIVKCCVAQYLYQDEEQLRGVMGLVCPYNNREDVRNSIKWIAAKEGDLNLIEYKGEKLIGDSKNGIVIWTSGNNIIASGDDPNQGGRLVDEVAKAYLKKYKNDFDLTEDDIPYVADPEKPES